MSPPRRLWVSSFVVLLGLGVTWALATPPLAHPDEPAHAVKAASVVRGQLVPPKVDLPDEGPEALLRGAFTTLVDVPAAYTFQTSEIPECYVWDSHVPAGCAPAWRADDTPAEWTAYIGRYPPGYYAAVGWPTLVDTGVGGFYAMRFLTAALNAALLATAIAMGATMRRFRLLPAGVVAATTPEVLILSGSVNPNSVEVAAAVCVWATLCVALVWDGERLPLNLVVALTVAGALLASARPLSSMWLAAIATGAVAAFGRREVVVRRLRERAARIGAAVVFAASAAGATWTALSDALGNNRGYNPWGLGPVDAAAHSVALTWSYLEQSVAAFGWIRTPGPAPLTVAWGVVVAALAVPAFRAADGRRRGALAGVAVLWLAMPTLLQAPTARSFGFVWSGRYGLALFAGVPILAAVILGTSERARPGRGVVAGALGLAALVQTAAHAAGMRRYVAGTDGPVNYLGQRGWRPPVDPAVLLTLTAGLALALALIAFRAAAGGPIPAPAPGPAVGQSTSA